LIASRMTLNDVSRFIRLLLYGDRDLRRILLAGL
jgi:hypothetical protein